MLAPGGLVGGVLAASVALTAAAVGRDRSPPVFAGLRTATTCLPGPIGGTPRPSSYRLSWPAARDDRTPARRIVYDVYPASSRGAERYGKPTWTTPPGVTVFVTPPLRGAATWYFVVRARDAAGNRDRNRHELLGHNVCM